MNRDCKSSQEWISEYARGGTGIPERVLRHIEECEACARAVDEAKKITALLTRADCVPEPPDCRSAVAARISRRERPRRFVWAYASAGTALAVALGVMCFVRWSPPPVPAKPTAIVKAKPVPKLPPRPSLAREQPSAAMHRTAVCADAGPRVRASLGAKSLPKHSSPAKHNSCALKPSGKEPAPVVAQSPPVPPPIRADERPVALVVVSWSGSGEPQRNEDYSYVSRNADDGSVTRCTVTHSGDSVVVNMETQTPAKELPVKGSMEHESNSNA